VVCTSTTTRKEEDIAGYFHQKPKSDSPGDCVQMPGEILVVKQLLSCLQKFEMSVRHPPHTMQQEGEEEERETRLAN